MILYYGLLVVYFINNIFFNKNLFSRTYLLNVLILLYMVVDICLLNFVLAFITNVLF